MRVIALDSFDNRKEGEEFEVSEKQGRQLLDKGLVKEGPVPMNKKAAPSDNAADPSEAAGEERPLSASRAARASGQTTAKKSAAGAKPRGRPRKTAE